jgi:signal peptidase I
MWPIVGGAIALVLASCLWVLRRKLAVVTVVGDSMWPTYTSGDRVLVRRVQLGDLRNGLVVVVEKPTADGRWHTAPPRGPKGPREWIIKRVVALPGDLWAAGSVELGQFEPFGRAVPADVAVPAGSFVVQGDNPGGSYDSRIFGYCPADRLLGVVVRSLSPSTRVAADRAVRP